MFEFEEEACKKDFFLIVNKEINKHFITGNILNHMISI